MPPTVDAYRRAARMRRTLTPPEARLWIQIKGGGLEGLKFRRQHPVGSYILDFYCPAARLAVEVDGAGHDDPEQIVHDARRTVWLKTQGIEVLRVRATDVRDHLDGVLAVILLHATGR
ncbi:endonuclease domain-containing protein [Brevundimonas vancanneytii]|uniref:endonuclease domain-containing protein n=1 Tax=Brevundimonas vancanneytii TaxID=1325724 RepID=UPI0010FE3412|nr:MULTISPECIES: endonuclease domain-containing protein [Brevundimonas]